MVSSVGWNNDSLRSGLRWPEGLEPGERSSVFLVTLGMHFFLEI